MKKVLSAKQMGEVDRRTTSEAGIPSLELMENAAMSVVSVICHETDDSVQGKRVLVLCGMGNNGGDGAAIARLLKKFGAHVTVLVAGKIAETHGDARTNFERLIDASESVDELRELDEASEIESFWQADEHRLPYDIVVDAVFGTGLDRPIEGKYLQFLESAERNLSLSPRPVLGVAVDLPSGLDSDLPQPIGYHLTADFTVTFTAPKVANVLPTACRAQGKLVVADIGSPKSLVDEMESQLFESESRDASEWLESTAFREDSFKKKRGSVLIAAGSLAFPGAAVLAGNSAMRSGAGIVTVAVPKMACASVSERILPEVMVKAVRNTESGAFSADSLADLDELIDKADVIGVGCGLTSDERATRQFVRDLIQASKCPLVIDADGLNSIAPYELSTDAKKLILTPHEGEFLRLTGLRQMPSGMGRVEAVRNFAVSKRLICVLKGERTLVAGPDGRVAVNPTGNSGLGKAGNGDNLAGLIAGFVAQTVAASGGNVEGDDELIFRAVVAAVYLGGLAGDIAAEKYGKHVMTASDVRDCLAEAFRFVKE